MENTPIYNLYGDPVNDRRLTYVSRYLERFLSDRTSCTVLDIGCGPWEYLPLLKEEWGIIGFDISTDYLKIARSRITSDYRRAELIRGDLAYLPFKNRAFDLIICLSVLPALNSPEKMVQKIKFLLKEGGIMIINVSWLQDILFHPVLTTFHRALDSIRKGNPNLFARAIFSGSDNSDNLKVRRWISLFILKDAQRKCIEKYARDHLNSNLKHFGNKHWFTPNEWIGLLEDCGLTILGYTGSYVVPPGIRRIPIPGALALFYQIEDILPSTVRKWLGRSFLIVASNQR